MHLEWYLAVPLLGLVLFYKIIIRTIKKMKNCLTENALYNSLEYWLGTRPTVCARLHLDSFADETAPPWEKGPPRSCMGEEIGWPLSYSSLATNCNWSFSLGGNKGLPWDIRWAFQDRQICHYFQQKLANKRPAFFVPAWLLSMARILAPVYRMQNLIGTLEVCLKYWN